jgi:hypothetical protein
VIAGEFAMSMFDPEILESNLPIGLCEDLNDVNLGASKFHLVLIDIGQVNRENNLSSSDC